MPRSSASRLSGRTAEPSIRAAGSGDLDGLAQSGAALFAEDGAARDRLRNPEWPSTVGRQWCAELLANPAALVLVAVDGDDIVGHLIGTFAEPSAMWTAPRAELVSMFVRSDCRGQGLGSRLVGEFAAWARERGASRLQVSAYAANAGAVRFYQRQGFVTLSTSLTVDM